MIFCDCREQSHTSLTRKETAPTVVGNSKFQVLNSKDELTHFRILNFGFRIFQLWGAVSFYLLIRHHIFCFLSTVKLWKK